MFAVIHEGRNGKLNDLDFYGGINLALAQNEIIVNYEYPEVVRKTPVWKFLEKNLGQHKK